MEFFITSNGIPVHVSDTGAGDTTILFLHGYLETLYIWDEFSDLLGGSFRRISIDLPGHGLSGTHPVSNDMEFDADAAAGILDKLSVASAVVIGHSMGGYVGQAMLRKYPERVSALVHFNSNIHSDDPDKRQQRLREISFIENGRLLSFAQIAIPNMYAKSNLRRCDDKIQETIEICETHDPFGISATVRGLMERPDNEEFLKSVKTPLLFVFGDSDIYTGIDAAKNILAAVPAAEGCFVPESGHNSFIEQPQTVMEALSDFLSGNGLS